MSKVVTVRLSNAEYKQIVSAAKRERRPLSSFMTLMVIKGLEEGAYVDGIEMAQITADQRLMKKLRAGHRDARQRKGKLVG